MKTLPVFTLFLFLFSIMNAQVIDIKDSTFIPNSASFNISYSPNDFILKISIVTINFTNGKQGIGLSVITKEIEKKPDIRIDSIVLSTSDLKTLVLNHPYKTSVASTYDGGYLMSAIHWLSKADVIFIKSETINRIMLTIDKKPLVIEVDKKSQREIKKITNKNL